MLYISDRLKKAEISGISELVFSISPE